MCFNIIIHGDIIIHHKKLNEEEHASKRFLKTPDDIIKIKDLIDNGKKKEALELINKIQKLQYELMEWCEEDVGKNIITEEEYLNSVNYFKLIYNKLTLFKQFC
jgi:Mg/Co/Ni transporter MgtE